ncbi:hypothetical protein F4804DRAFT_207898 [Jackrogersella minutella]|nr:hypothetical protein F4804DRAFT_207898 [Jackrogersella minutella]
MEEASSPLDQHISPPSPPPSPSNIVQIPICRPRVLGSAFLQQFVPYDNPAVFDVRPTQWHHRQQGIFFFRYTDYRGWPGVQPAADERRIRSYFQPLDDDDERSGGVDNLLLEARCWCCWAQGFTYLEPELRWVLTLIFDLVAIVIAKQRAVAARKPILRGEDVDMDMDADSVQLFWEGRYYLHNLMGVARDMKDTFGIENFTIPRLPWVTEN